MAKKTPNFSGKPGEVKVVIEPNGVENLLRGNKPIRDLLVQTAQSVASEAQSTASDAENGPGGRIDGYAAAGFMVEYENRPGRPRVNIRSNADGKTALAAHFHSQIVNGVGHLRAALYKFTSRG